MELNEGENYLFFPKADLAEGKVTGLANSQVCVLCTKGYLFIVPYKSVSDLVVATKITTYNYFGEGIKPSEGMEKILQEEGLTVEELERRMTEMLSAEADKRIFKIADLEKFNIGTGFFGQARFKKPGAATRALVLKGKGSKKRMKVFYEG